MSKPEAADATLLGAVLGALARVVGPAADDLAADSPLERVDAFDSIALAGFLDEVEATTGIAIRADLVVPEHFVTPAAIAAVLAASRPSAALRGAGP